MIIRHHGVAAGLCFAWAAQQIALLVTLLLMFEPEKMNLLNLMSVHASITAVIAVWAYDIALMCKAKHHRRITDGRTSDDCRPSGT